MRYRLRSWILILLLTVCSGAAHAQSESDRLREALASTTAQLRAIENEKLTLIAKQAALERDKQALKADVDKLKGDLKEVKAQHRQAVKDFNARIAERDETLEKWRTAYAEAAGVARTKDAERAKFEAEAKELKERVSGCVQKNVKLYKISNEILTRYERVDVNDAFEIREPFIGFKRVELQNLVQEYGNQIKDGKEITQGK